MIEEILKHIYRIHFATNLHLNKEIVISLSKNSEYTTTDKKMFGCIYTSILKNKNLQGIEYPKKREVDLNNNIVCY